MRAWADAFEVYDLQAALPDPPVAKRTRLMRSVYQKTKVFGLSCMDPAARTGRETSCSIYRFRGCPVEIKEHRPSQTRWNHEGPSGISNVPKGARSTGLEPATPAVTGRCSNQIELRPH